MTGLIRSFIAIPLPAEVQKNLADFSRQMGLYDRSSGLRPVRPDNIHITLKFLGEINQQQVTNLGQCLSEAVAGLTPFQVEIRGIGAFPGWQKAPRVIWVGASPAQPLQQVFKAVESAAVKAGFEAEGRPFSPHLTVARVSLPGSGSSQPVIERLRNLSAEPLFGDLQVAEVILFKSVLQAGGPIYTRLSSHSFKV